jgi:hypothetical protein
LVALTVVRWAAGRPVRRLTRDETAARHPDDPVPALNQGLEPIRVDDAGIDLEQRHVVVEDLVQEDHELGQAAPDQR